MSRYHELRKIAARIHARYGKPPSKAWKAASKLIIAPRFAHSDRRSRRIGWKPGELQEMAEVILRRASRVEVAYEVADVAYYAAQSLALIRLVVRRLLRVLGWTWPVAIRVALAKYRLRADGKDKASQKAAVQEEAMR